jgi:hypothetical protein
MRQHFSLPHFRKFSNLREFPRPVVNGVHFRQKRLERALRIFERAEFGDQSEHRGALHTAGFTVG